MGVIIRSQSRTLYWPALYSRQSFAMLYAMLLVVLSAAATMAYQPSVLHASQLRSMVSRTNSISMAAKKAKAVAVGPEKSASIPFLNKQPKLDGSLPGDVGFDPFGLSNLFDINYLRAAELKHGRIGMLASLGFLVQETWHLPGDQFQNPNPLEAIGEVPAAGLAQIFVAAAFIESTTADGLFDFGGAIYDDNLTPLQRRNLGLSGPAYEAAGSDGPSKLPGDLGWDPLGLADNGVNPFFAEAEIKHARLGMLGAAGMLVQAIITGKPVTEGTFEWLGYA